MNHPSITRSTLLAWIAAAVLTGCSVDPIGELFRSESGPFTEQVGPFLRLTFNPGPDRYPSWSNDGTRIVYSAGGFEPGTQEHITINVIPAQGGISERISPVFARVDNNFYPGWFDEDGRIAYISFRGVNFATPTSPTLTTVDPIDERDFIENAFDLNNPFDLDIAPDGMTIAWSDFNPPPVDSSRSPMHPGDGRLHGDWETSSNRMTAIWTMEFPLDGKSFRVPGTTGAGELTWSPDSETIAFARSGYIYTIPIGGGFPDLFVEGTSPAWSPDGSRMAVVIGGNIFMHRLDDGERFQITTEGGIDPAWSPDGERLAFSWERNGSFDIYVVNLADVIESP
jgi:hypothetical protein